MIGIYNRVKLVYWNYIESGAENSTFLLHFQILSSYLQC
nr:MAG TPA: hypothetical protein [Caudoviricetes sp.]